VSYISNRDFLIEVAKGKVPKHSLVHKFARNPSVVNGATEGILQASTAFTFRQSVSKFKIAVGGNAADDAAGLGAQGVVLQGIDDSLNEVTDTLVSAGASASADGAVDFWRVHRAWVHPCGTYGGNNTGNIVITDSAGAASHIMIAAGEGQSQYGAFTIPTGHTGYLISVHGSVDAAKPADILMYTRKNFNDVTTPFTAARLKLYYDGVKGFLPYTPQSPELELAALTDIWFNAIGDGNDTSVSIDFEILLVED
jgi:hypothetical protein